MDKEFLLQLLENYSKTPAHHPAMSRGFCHFIFWTYQDKNLFETSNAYFKPFFLRPLGYVLPALIDVKDRESAKQQRIQWLKNHIDELEILSYSKSCESVEI